MNKFEAFIFFLIIIFLAGCDENTIEVENPGEITTTIRTVKSFSEIEVNAGIKLILKQGSVEDVRIEAREGFQPYIYTYVTDGILNIKLEDKIKSSDVIEKTAYVILKSLNSITTSGGSNIEATTPISSSNFSMNLSGGSVLSFTLNTSKLSSELSGGSKVTLIGSTQDLIATLSGGSKFYTYSFPSSRTTIDASGGSNAELNVKTELDVTASGGSMIKYQGNPLILKQNLSGGSQLIKVGS